VAAPLLVLACQQLLSIDGTVAVASSEACGLGVEAGACQACIASQCCEQATACAQAPSCAGYESCLLACGSDYECRATCVQSNVIGSTSEVPTFDQCVASNCADPCGVSCGLTGSYASPDAAQGCQACINAHACTASQACVDDLNCELAGHCAYACRTPDCQQACLAQYDGGAFLTAAYDVGSTCLSACQVGNFWACVGNVSWPFAKQKSIDATLTVLDSTSRKPVEGAVVLACTHGDDPCTAPLANTTTTQQGGAEMKLSTPTGPYGFQGYFDVTSPTQLLVHHQYFLSFPLSEPQAQLQLIALSPAALQTLVSVAHVQLDPTRGIIAVAAEDCLLINSPGVTATAQGIDSKTQRFYYQGGALGANATATDGSGLIFFFNVPPGPVHIDVTPQALGRVSSSVDVIAQPNVLTVVQGLPTPP
jgi:hypothetical protein